MRCVVSLVIAIALLTAQPALSQSLLTTDPGRLPTPRAIDGWQPSSQNLSTDATGNQTPRVGDRGLQTYPQPTAAPGWQVGPATWLYPAITIGTFWDDNVFAAPVNKQSDWAFVVRPEIGMRTTGDNYSFYSQAMVEGRTYGRLSSENQTNAAAVVGGVVQPDANTQMVGRFRYTHAHEDRGVSESELFKFDRPVAYDTYEIAGALNKRMDRWWTSVGAAGLLVNYTTPTIGGIPQDQSYRNGTTSVATVRVGYVLAPLTSVFGEVQGNSRDFEVNVFDSTGYRAVVGMLWEPGQGAFLKGEVFAGYMAQDYRGPTFQSVSTWTYGASLAWLLAPNLTAVFEGRREAKESALAPLGVVCTTGTAIVVVICGTSVIETLAGARLDYAVTEKLIVGGGATYLTDKFLGAARTDHALSPLASVKYLASEKLILGLDYRYLTFNSSGLLVPGYTRNVVLVSMHGKF